MSCTGSIPRPQQQHDRSGSSSCPFTGPTWDCRLLLNISVLKVQPFVLLLPFLALGTACNSTGWLMNVQGAMMARWSAVWLSGQHGKPTAAKDMYSVTRQANEGPSAVLA